MCGGRLSVAVCLRSSRHPLCPHIQNGRTAATTGSGTTPLCPLTILTVVLCFLQIALIDCTSLIRLLVAAVCVRPEPSSLATATSCRNHLSALERKRMRPTSS